jgi:hypothetical protein
MIPYDQMDPSAVEALKRYLITELRQVIGERAPIEAIWKRWLRAYKAEPEQRVKNFPFRGSANLVIPVIASDVETIWSRLMGLLFGPENLWSTKPLRPDMVDFAPRLQEFLAWAQRHDIPNLEGEIADWLLDICKLGTGVLKTRYNRQQQEVYEWRETGAGPGQGIYEAERLIWLHDHPEVKRVAVNDFYLNSSANSIKDARWSAERITLTWAQLVQRVQSGLYSGAGLQSQFGSYSDSFNALGPTGPLEPLRSWWARSRGSQLEQFRQRMDHVVPGYGDLFEVFEFWLNYDIRNNTRPRALVCTIHLESESYLRLDWNPFFNQEKPYDDGRYLRQEGRFWGIGLCEMLYGTQEEVSTMNNQRIDNATVVNVSMFTALKTSNIMQDEPLWPGRILEVQSHEDLKALPMGQKYDSTVPAEEMVINYARNRTGVNDYISGNNDPSIGYAALGTNIAQQTQAAKRFDQVLRECRTCLSSVGQKVVELYQQFSQGQKTFFAMGPQDGKIVQQILRMPTDLIRMGVAIDVTATSAAFSKDADIRTNMLVMQMMMQVNQQILQGTMMLVNPQTPPPIKMLLMQMMQGTLILARRNVDDYGIQDANRIVPDLNQAFYGQPTGAITPFQQFGADPSAQLGGPPVGSGLAGPQGLPLGAGASGGTPLLGPGSNTAGGDTGGLPFAG